MSYLSAAFLGLVQGVAEFLPISSSGHLSIFQNFLGLNQMADGGHVFFDLLLHLATLLAVCVFYRRDILDIIFQSITFVKTFGHPVPGEKKKYPAVRLLVMMFFATLPLFLILPIKDKVEALYNNTMFIGFALIFCGAMLYVSDRLPRRSKNEKTMTIKDALIIGVFQAIATVPGVSRSGATITGGIATGLERQFAVKFSFLISIPAILGANILSIADAVEQSIDSSLIPMYLVGMLVAAVSGYLCLMLLRWISRKGRFGGFAFYCWVVGIATIILTIVL